jgi:DNA repair exonuclease SbcCD nuclease subunit
LREQQEKYKPEATFILGDMGDKKDCHSSVMVNRTVTEMLTLKPPIYILKGNHDYIDPNNPFFKFMNHLPGIKFVVEPTMLSTAILSHKFLLIPHCPTEKAFEAACGMFGRPDYLLLHQTFEGAIAETGVRLSGYKQAPIEQMRPGRGIYAGDVHRPQRAALVNYVGAPYHIRFGDAFDPRCILVLGHDRDKNLYFDTVRKWSLTVRDVSELLDNKDLLPGDQIKVEIELAREEMVDWKDHKCQVLEAAREKGLEVFGVELKVNTSTSKKQKVTVSSFTHTEVFDSFCATENVSSAIKETGHTLLKL